MATKKPVMCPNCGAHIRKSGYCSECKLHINMLKKAYNTSNYHYNIAYDKAVARDLSGAIISLKNSLRYNKKNIRSRNLLGLIYYEMGEVVTALSHWVMSVNFQPSNNLASVYLDHLRDNAAEMENADSNAKKFNMALDYAKRDDHDLAILQLKNVIVSNPHFVKGYLLLALLYIQNRNYEKARTTLRRVLKIDKANTLAIHYLHEMGDTDENIIQMRMETVENDGLLDDKYLETADEDIDFLSNKSNIGRKIKGIISSVFSKGNETSSSEYKAINYSKNSSVYVLIGLVLGILILFFFIAPSQKKKIKNEYDDKIKNYSEELASKNSTISLLNSEIEALNSQVEALMNSSSNEGGAMPDYSGVQNGMSDDDIQSMIDNE